MMAYGVYWLTPEGPREYMKVPTIDQCVALLTFLEDHGATGIRVKKEGWR